MHVLPNPIRLASWGGVPRAEQATKRIVAAGRLVPQKGFDALIASFAALADDHPDWQLVIYGEGADRAALETAGERRRGIHRTRRVPGGRDAPGTACRSHRRTVSAQLWRLRRLEEE